MARSIPFNSKHSLSDRDTLLVTLFLAAVVHVLLIVGVNFALPEPPKMAKSIDVTLVTTPAKKAPEKAKFLAQENQLGAGMVEKKAKPPAQKLVSQGQGQSKRQVQRSPIEASPKAERKVVTQKKSVVKSPSKTDKPVVEKPFVEHQQLSQETLRQQIAQVGTEIGFGQHGSDHNPIKFANLASAKQYGAAQYLKDWENKVERTGNLNYPEVAIRKGFSSSLMMDVGLKSDGSIYSIKIRKSSGNKALDDAAKRIVKLSAPFPPLPLDVLKELKLKQQDVLVISRVWIFSDESGMTAR